jgi:predicted nuclease with TOPRIM domain
MEKDVTSSLPPQSESDKLWQEYLQKCCEVGQLRDALKQLDSQKNQIEKNIEVTERAVSSVREKHKKHQEQALKDLKPKAPEADQTKAVN